MSQLNPSNAFDKYLIDHAKELNLKTSTKSSKKSPKKVLKAPQKLSPSGGLSMNDEKCYHTVVAKDDVSGKMRCMLCDKFV